MRFQQPTSLARRPFIAGALVFAGLVIPAVDANSQMFPRGLRLNEPTLSGQYLSVGNKTGLQGNNSYTIEAWVRPISYSGFPTIVGNNFTSSFWVGLNLTGRIRFYPRGGNFVESVGIVPLNRWTHVAVTYSSVSGWAIYLDGVLDAGGGGITGAPGTSTDSLGIGADLSGGVPDFFWRGGLDEVRIWRTALTAAMIREVMVTGAGMRNHTGPRYADVEAYWGFTFITPTWAFDETVEPDATGENNFAVFNGYINAMLDQGNPQMYYNQAVLLNGTDDHISIEQHTSYAAGVTIEAWIHPFSTAGFPTIAGRDYTSSFWFGLTPAGRLRLYPRGGVGGFLDGIGSVPLNAWTHVAATYDPATGTSTLYINGEVDLESTAITGPIGENGRDIFVGADNLAAGTSFYFPGMMDEVCITDGVIAGDRVRTRRFIGTDPFLSEATNGITDIYGAARFTYRAHMGMYAYLSIGPDPLILINGSHARLVVSGAPLFRHYLEVLPVELYLLGPTGGQGFTPPDQLTLGSLTTTIAAPAGFVNDVNVFVSLSCDDLTKLSCTLRSPAGSTVELIETGQLPQGRSLQTILDDGALNTVSNSWVPFEYNLRPPGSPLNTFNGEAALGDWDIELSLSDASHMAVWAVGLGFAMNLLSVGGDAAPREILLANAGPEPVRRMGAVRFTLPEAANIELGLYDLLGRRLRSLQRGTRNAGEHRVTWSSAGLEAGRYFLQLEVEGGTRRGLPVTVLR